MAPDLVGTRSNLHGSGEYLGLKDSGILNLNHPPLAGNLADLGVGWGCLLPTLHWQGGGFCSEPICLPCPRPLTSTFPVGLSRFP